MAGRSAGEALWRFSLLVYTRPGVADALIRLQDRAGHNVNLILFALWLGLCEGTRLDAAGLERARAAMAGLDRDVVAPLRRLRRALKADRDPDVRALRRRVLALEIAAERRVLARLAGTAPSPAGRAGDRQAFADANLGLVLGGDIGSAEAALILKAAAAC